MTHFQIIVYVHLSFEQPHPRFTRSPSAPDDLVFRASISLCDALTGCVVVVQTLDGRSVPVPVAEVSNANKHSRVVLVVVVMLFLLLLFLLSFFGLRTRKHFTRSLTLFTVVSSHHQIVTPATRLSVPGEGKPLRRHTYTYTLSHTHAHTRAHTHALTHTYAHTYTFIDCYAGDAAECAG
jgi:hypothetical protein